CDQRRATSQGTDLVTNHPGGGRFLCMLVVPGMATAGVRPCLSLQDWSRSLPTPQSPGWGSAPDGDTPGVTGAAPCAQPWCAIK
uniref:Uncharacterized protein n=1 Tax=Ficedula albicollis TaxID=59894 RepID=A0A803WEL3_FICAL